MARVPLLLRPRWIVGHVLVVAVAAACISLGLWQLRRLDQRLAYNALVEARLAAPPQPLAALEDQVDVAAPAQAADSAAYRRARVSGRYDTDRELLLRSRAYQGRAGYHVLTPLVFAPGRAILIDRGWVPYEMNEPPVLAAAPPAGRVTVTGMLVASQHEPASRLAPKDPATGPLDAVFWVDILRLADQFPYVLEPVYLELGKQVPAQAGELPVPPPPPELSRGPHMGYALQWFSFALIALLGYPIVLRRSVRKAGERAGLGPQGAGIGRR
ncbi:MAG TPA: SURF1 family protein [Trueperaceae bacterium]